MTDKQLLKRLQYQQNRLLDIKGYSFYLSLSDGISINRYFNIYIHDVNNNHHIIYNDTFEIKDSSLNTKLNKLKDFIDGLFNNEKTRD